MTADTSPYPLERLEIQVGPHTHGALAAGPADGELVLLLHGWPQFADSWSEVLPGLAAAGYRALAVDQRGYAPGARPEGVAAYAVTELVADALAFADSQGADRFHLVGHDWGGLLAWVLAGAHPDRLRSVTSLATPHPGALRRAVTEDPDQQSRSEYVALFRTPGTAEESLLADGASLMRQAFGGHVPDALVEANIARLREPGALTASLNWYREPAETFALPAARITVPTLYVWGTEDIALGRRATELTAEWVDGPYHFEALDGASHWLPEELPGKVTALLVEHLGRHS